MGFWTGSAAGGAIRLEEPWLFAFEGEGGGGGAMATDERLTLLGRGSRHFLVVSMLVPMDGSGLGPGRVGSGWVTDSRSMSILSRA